MKTLVVEDDPTAMLLHTTALKERGHEVLQAEDGDVAWSLFCAERPALVVLDWQMPRLDGLKLCRKIRQEEPERETFVLMVTARDQEDDLLSVLDAGADDYMSKPFSGEALRVRISIAERRIALDRAARKGQDELRQSQYMAGIGETAVALQHEINNPLAALMGNLQLLERNMVPEADVPGVIGDVLSQGKRIAEVLRRLRELTEVRTVTYADKLRMLDLSGGDG